MSAQRPNPKRDKGPENGPHDDPGQNTSDEDQEDLPYDGDFNQTRSSQSNTASDGRQTVHASPDVPGVHESVGEDDDFQRYPPAASRQAEADPERGSGLPSEPSEAALSRTRPPPDHSHPDMKQLLLRHFSQEELLLAGRLIAEETLPEVSLLESVDDFLVSHSSAPINSTCSKNLACHGEINPNLTGKALKNSSVEEETENQTDSITSAASELSSPGSRHNSTLEVERQEGHVQRVPFVRTRSLSEFKYGQGQVHYPLPDFSKIAPKVKIPRASSGPAIKPHQFHQAPGSMHRAQSSPGMLEVISRVLEDSVQPTEKAHVFQGARQHTPPALERHLQVGPFPRLFGRNLL